MIFSRVTTTARWPAPIDEEDRGYFHIFVNGGLLCPFATHLDLASGRLFQRIELDFGGVIKEPTWFLATAAGEVVMADEARSRGFVFAEEQAFKAFRVSVSEIPHAKPPLLELAWREVVAVLGHDVLVQYSLDDRFDVNFAQGTLRRMLAANLEAVDPCDRGEGRLVVRVGLSKDREISLEISSSPSGQFARLVDPFFVPFWIKV